MSGRHFDTQRNRDALDRYLTTEPEPTPHAYEFDPDWDGLCRVCGAERGDSLHTEWILAQDPPADWPAELDWHKRMLKELED